MATLWLRAETYGFPTPDARTPLTPEQAHILLESGHKVFIEKSQNRIIPDSEYEKAGCTIVEAGSWYYDSPPDAHVLGIKYVEKEERFNPKFALMHNLIYFAHGWNCDEEGARIISRLEERGMHSHHPATFHDLEDLVDDEGKRVAAFGYYAGYAGALLSVRVWCQKELGEKPPYHAPDSAIGREAMIEEIKGLLAQVKRKTGENPSTLVIAPSGRCGKGAVALLNDLGLKHTPWTREQTSKGPPFPEILKHDIFLNCVSFSTDNPKFITKADLEKDHKLSVIGDVSCYPGPFNPVDIYDHITSFDNLTHTVTTKGDNIDVIAVENLPRLLAREASVEYSSQLFTHIKELLDAVDKGGEMPVVWQRAADKSYKILSGASAIKDLGMTISSTCFEEGSDKLDAEKAEKILLSWLKRNPLDKTQIAGFSRLLSDGATQVYKMRSGQEDHMLKPQLLALEEWSENLDVKTLCASPRIAPHHDIEVEADNFLRSAAGKFLMKNESLRGLYMKALDSTHLALEGSNSQRSEVEKAVEEAKAITATMSPHLGRMINQSMDNIREICVVPSESRKKDKGIAS